MLPSSIKNLRGGLLCGILTMSSLAAQETISVAMEVPDMTSYIYAPGLGGGPVLIGKYCTYYEAPTGEIIKGTTGGNILGNGKAISTVTFAEIDTKLTRSWYNDWYYQSVRAPFAGWMFKKRFGIEVEKQPNHEVSFYNYGFKLNCINIGQEKDITCLRTVFAEHTDKFGPETEQIVLVGDSRGAATTFNFMALDHPNISCAILEGIFDSMPHVITHLRYHHSIFCFFKQATLASLLKKVAGSYSHEGPFPIDYVKEFPYDTPVLMVTSLTDEIVPHECTMNLYIKLLQSGHTNVRLLILPCSRHDGYMLQQDKDRYEQCVHAFYRSCGVDHDLLLAEQGEAILAETQPSVDEIRRNYLDCKSTKYRS